MAFLTACTQTASVKDVIHASVSHEKTHEALSFNSLGAAGFLMTSHSSPMTLTLQGMNERFDDNARNRAKPFLRMMAQSSLAVLASPSDSLLWQKTVMGTVPVGIVSAAYGSRPAADFGFNPEFGYTDCRFLRNHFQVGGNVNSPRFVELGHTEDFYTHEGRQILNVKNSTVFFSQRRIACRNASGVISVWERSADNMYEIFKISPSVLSAQNSSSDMNIGRVWAGLENISYRCYTAQPLRFIQNPGAPTYTQKPALLAN